MAYLLDANVLIRAKNEYYGFDLCPGFWEWLDLSAERGEVLSVEAVYDELAPQADDVAEWVRQRPEMFMTATADVVAAVQSVNTWAMADTQFTAAAKNDFASAADSWLVAHALAGDHVVVTHELLGRYRRNIIKIPNAANQFGVRHVQPYLMLRELGARFVLDPAISRQTRLL